MVIGGFFAVVAIILSVLLIAVRRASLRFDEWLLGRIRLRLIGIQFYGWYLVIASCGLTVLLVLYETRLFNGSLLLAIAAGFLLVVAAVLAWHRKSLHDRGIYVFKQRQGAARS
jgi:hypothetical protein